MTPLRNIQSLVFSIHIHLFFPSYVLLYNTKLYSALHIIRPHFTAENFNSLSSNTTSRHETNFWKWLIRLLLITCLRTLHQLTVYEDIIIFLKQFKQFCACNGIKFLSQIFPYFYFLRVFYIRVQYCRLPKYGPYIQIEFSPFLYHPVS